jgi:putative restriction endonuclease
MNFYVGVTDTAWYNYLSKIQPEDVNFWRPGGNSTFKVIEEGAPFLFKLKSPYNAIGGIGFFASYSLLPISLVWEIFGNRNGYDTYSDFYNGIKQFRSADNSLDKNPNVGCIVLTNPVFFRQEDWIPLNWGSGIVQGKSYSTDESDGKRLWEKVKETLYKYPITNQDDSKNQFLIKEPVAQYGESVLVKVRLGQGAFRVLLTDTYQRRCAISGEKTLPVLEAAHIKPYSESGPHAISNGLLLRSDIHKLFDSNYLTITKDLKVEVSRKIKEEFQNGKEYYKYHGQQLVVVPEQINNRPDSKYIEWHNSHFKG